MGKGYSLRMRAGSTSEADLFIYEDVGASFFGGVTAKMVADDLKAIGAVQTINVRINSYGGEVFDGLAIYNQLKAHPAKIVVHIDGVAASIASVIAMAGDVIRISEAGFVMIHNPAGVCIGEATDMLKMAEMLEKVTGSTTEVYAQRTGQTPEALRAMMAEETWFTGEEALEAGFADEMVVSVHMAAHLDPIKHPFKHVPATLSAAVAAEQTTRPRLSAARDLVAKMGARLGA